MLLHEAQVMDTQDRTISAFNELIKVIENNPGNRTLRQDEENNLNIQITVASDVFHAKRFAGRSGEILTRLEKEFKDAINKVPPRLQGEMKKYIDAYESIFKNRLAKDIPLVGVTGAKMTRQDQQNCLFALNQANLMNDQIKADSENATSADQLTVFKKQKEDFNNPTYMADYGMKDQYAKVFVGHAQSQKHSQKIEEVKKQKTKLGSKFVLSVNINGSPAGDFTIELTNAHDSKAFENIRSHCAGEKGFTYKGAKFTNIKSNICQLDPTDPNRTIYGGRFSAVANARRSCMPGSVLLTHDTSGTCGSKLTFIPNGSTGIKNSYTIVGKVISGMEIINKIAGYGAHKSTGASTVNVTISNCRPA